MGGVKKKGGGEENNPDKGSCIKRAALANALELKN